VANEVQVAGSLRVSKGGTSEALDIGPLSLTLTGTRILHNRQNVGTSEEALALSEVVPGGWLLVINRDASNYVQLKTATGGTAFARLLAGEFCLLRLDSGLSAPFVQANTAACDIEYVILPA
jgi:hypothetical protein